MFESEIDELKRWRDELRVQLQLGKLEVRDRFHVLEERWEKLEQHLQRAERVAEEEWEDVRSAAGLLVDEIREGYAHIREQL